MSNKPNQEVHIDMPGRFLWVKIIAWIAGRQLTENNRSHCGFAVLRFQV